LTDRLKAFKKFTPGCLPPGMMCLLGLALRLTMDLVRGRMLPGVFGSGGRDRRKTICTILMRSEREVLNVEVEFDARRSTVMKLCCCVVVLVLLFDGRRTAGSDRGSLSIPYLRLNLIVKMKLNLQANININLYSHASF
jgi:hypothetical protein